MTLPIHRFSHEAMTTSFDALIVHPDEKYAGQAAAAVFMEISRLERLLSRYDPGTDLAQVNRLRPGGFMVVNLEVVECLETAARAYAVTAGAFDVAYRSTRNGTRPSAMDFLLLSRPDEEEPDAPAEFLVGFAPEAATAEFGADMQIPLPARTLERNQSSDPTPPDSANLDLGGVGKGYALDKAQVILDDWGIENALLSAGTSTVLSRGAGPEGKGWPVGVSGDFFAETGIEMIHLHNEALSGSGSEIKGEHVRMPATGQAAPAKAAWARAKSAAWTDAISTAFMVMSREKAKKFGEQHSDIACIAVYPDADPIIIGNWDG